MDSIKDKSYKSYDYISRYQSFPYYYNVQDNKYIYGTTSQLDTNVGYSIHVVKTNDTYDSIALDYYNSPSLYWIICDFNKVQDPFTSPQVGTKIKVPVLSNLVFKEIW